MPGDWLSVPHFRQEFPYSCVPACLRMVLAHFGRNHSEDELRRLLETGPQGTRAGNLLAAGNLGFHVQISGSTLPLLQAELASGVPPIVFLETGALDYWRTDCAHVAVLVGVDGTTATTLFSRRPNTV